MKQSEAEQIEALCSRFLPARGFRTGAWVLVYFAVYVSLLSSYLNQTFDKLDFDESQWIWVSQRYFTLIMKRDFHNPKWSESYMKFGCYNPKIAQYLIGFSLRLGGELNTHFKAMKWKWRHSIEWNERQGNAPPFRTLFYGRLIMPFVGAGTVLFFLFFISRKLSRLPSLMASLFLGGHFIFGFYSARAMQDLPALFFLTLSLAFTIACDWRRILKKPRSSWLWLGLAGILLGLAVGTKLNNLPLLVIWCAYLGWVCGIEIQPNFRINLRGAGSWAYSILISLSLAGAVFIGSNPYLYAKSPVTSLRKAQTFLQLANVVAEDREKYPENALYTLRDKFSFVKKKVIPPRSTRARRRYYLLFFFGILGLGGSFKRGIKIKSARETDRTVWLILVVIILFLANLAWIPLKYERLVLPILISAAILIGFALDFLLMLAAAYFLRIKALIFAKTE